MVGAIPGTNVTLCCEASGSPRPNVFQEDGCLQIKMVKEDVDFICRAKNSFGLAETTTTVIAEVLGGIIYYFCCKALKICSWKVVSIVSIARYVC